MIGTIRNRLVLALRLTIYSLTNQEPSCFDRYFKYIHTVPIRSVVPMIHSCNIKSLVHKISFKEYTGKHFPKHPGTRPPHARLDRMKTRLRAKNTFANWAQLESCVNSVKSLLFLVIFLLFQVFKSLHKYFEEVPLLSKNKFMKELSLRRKFIYQKYHQTSIKK